MAPGPHLGEIWKYFQVINESNKKKKYVKCNYCAKEYHHGNASRMKKHLIECRNCPEETKTTFKELLQLHQQGPVTTVRQQDSLPEVPNQAGVNQPLIARPYILVQSVACQTKERSEDFSNELVRAVEQHAELYRGGYTSEEKKKHWEEIATDLGQSVRYCKEEWRCLKKLFQTHVNDSNGPEDTGDVEQMELMAFLLPYVNEESDESEGEVEETTIQDDDDHFEDPLDDKCTVFENVKAYDPKPSKPSTSRKRKAEPIPDDSSKKLFLLSLMPDVRLMDDTQMRKFKRKVLEIIDEILNDD